MKNFRIADIDKSAMYKVTLIDRDDETQSVRIMAGSELVELYNAAAHMYDFYADFKPCTLFVEPAKYKGMQYRHMETGLYAASADKFIPRKFW